MTRPLRLTDFRLLACQFEIVGGFADRAAEATPPSGESGPAATDSDNTTRAELAADEPDDRRHEIPGVELDYSTEEEDDQFVFILRVEVVDPSVPYKLEVVTGARFDIPDPPVTASQAQATLLFVSYPYVRELVASITGRSPYQAYELPPLTRLPHPTVTGEDEGTSVEEQQDQPAE